MLSEEQRIVLTKLAAYSEAPTTRRLADDLESPESFTRLWGYDMVHAKLKRLHARGLVTRDGRRPAHWSVSTAGHNELGMGL